MTKITRDIQTDSGRDLEHARLIINEMMEGFLALRGVGSCVTCFGSARFDESHEYYNLAYETAKEVSKIGLNIITGGGPGIMEAANKGAQEIGVKSIGCKIALDKEQEPNPYVDEVITFDYFFTRKFMLEKYSSAFIIFPGGVGTLDEMFETITLLQTKKMKRFPLVVMGKKFWNPIKNFVLDSLVSHQTITEEDLDLVYYTDDPVDAAMYIKRKLIKYHGFEEVED